MISLQTANNALKDVYLGVIANQINCNTDVLLGKIKHTSNDLKKECVDKVFEDKAYEREKEKKELYQQILEMQKTMNELLIKVSSL